MRWMEHLRKTKDHSKVFYLIRRKCFLRWDVKRRGRFCEGK